MLVFANVQFGHSSAGHVSGSPYAVFYFMFLLKREADEHRDLTCTTADLTPPMPHPLLPTVTKRGPIHIRERSQVDSGKTGF